MFTGGLENQTNRYKGSDKSRNRENGFVTDLISECLGMSYCSEWEIIIIKGIFGEDQCINDSEYGRRIC